MSQEKGRIPLFATIVSVLMMLVGFFFAFGFFTNPAQMMPKVDLGNPALAGLVFMMGTRSFSMALALLVALLLKSPRGLIAVLSMRAATEILDLVSIVNGPDAQAGAIVVVGVMIAIELVAIALLWRSLRSSPSAA